MKLLRACIGVLLLVSCSTSDGGGSGSGGRSDSGTTSVDAGAISTTDAGIAGVRIVGRWDDRDPSGPRIGWPGTRVVVRFRGTGASMRIQESAADDGPSRYDVVVDGAVKQVLAAPTNASDVVLAAGLANGEHTVELVRRTEGRLGTTQILGTSVAGGALLAPPAPAARRIEFLGDSETNGYGIEGDGPDCRFSAATQNESKAYPALVAAALDAERVTVAYSGKGVLRNADASDTEVFPLLYPRAVPTDPSSLWSSAKLPIDAVIVALGGNDWERPDPAVFDPPSTTALQTKYAELAATIRTAYPSAHVFCGHPASLTNDHPEGYDAYTKMKAVLEAVVAARNGSGDDRVYYLELPRASDADRTGCDYHYGPAFHQKVAAAIVPIVRAKTGW